MNNKRTENTFFYFRLKLKHRTSLRFKIVTFRNTLNTIFIFVLQTTRNNNNSLSQYLCLSQKCLSVCFQREITKASRFLHCT